MKNRKKLMAGLLSCTVIISYVVLPTCTVSAADTSNNRKEEVVYVMLDADGNTDSVNVVNIFGKGGVTDFGNYSSVKMLTSTTPISKNGNKITFTSDSDKIYYQGTLNNAQIPWNIQVKYKVNGKSVTADELAGASGTLEIHIQITQNSLCKVNFFDSYALQTAFTLDTNKCKNIVADGATLANVGADKQISYTVLPGKGLDATVSADVTDFEMDAVAINGIKLDLNVEIDDEELMDKVTEIMDASSKLNDGATTLTDGTNKLADGSNNVSEGAATLYNGVSSLDQGVTSLNNGISSIQAGINGLNSKSSSLTGGSDKIMEALQTIQTSLTNVSVSTEQLKTLTDNSSEIKQGISQLYDGALNLQSNLSYEKYKEAMNDNGLNIDTLTAGNTQTITTLSEQISDLQNTIGQLKAIPGYEGNEQYVTQIAALEAQVDSLSSIVMLLKGNNAAIGGTESYLNTVSSGVDNLVSGLSTLKSNYETFDTAIISLSKQLSGLMVNMSTLKSGIDSLVTNYEALDSGINEYTEGVATIAANYSKLVEGVGALTSGSKELLDGSGILKSGTADLYNGVISLSDGAAAMSDGTDEFYNKTSDMDVQVQNQIDKMISSISGEQTDTVSFVSDKNTNIDSVQFVIKTTAIEKVEAQVQKEQKSVKRNVWQKLLHLFGL